jgi:hypothetical protein
MRANKTTLIFLLVLFVILFCVALANTRYISTPRLVIKFEGKPLSHVTLVLPTGSDGPYQLDKEGSITAREIGWTETSILVPFPDGGGATVGFPKHGTKTVDFQGRVTTTTLVQYFGLVSEEFESFNLTEEEMADIESGRRSSAEIVEAIRQREGERERLLDSSTAEL